MQNFADAGAPEILGNTTDPKAFMKWQYWGGWGYKPHVLKAIAEIETTDLKGQLQFHLYKDPQITGRNEATLFKDAACSGDGILVFSKLNSKKQPDADQETLKMFCDMVKEEIANLWAPKAMALLPTSRLAPFRSLLTLRAHSPRPRRLMGSL